MYRNFQNDPSSSSPLEFLVGPPQCNVLQGRGEGGDTGFLHCGIQGDPTGEFTQRFRGHFGAILDGTLSETIIHLMPEALPKLCVFRTCPETFEITIIKMPRLSQ